MRAQWQILRKCCGSILITATPLKFADISKNSCQKSPKKADYSAGCWVAARNDLQKRSEGRPDHREPLLHKAPALVCWLKPRSLTVTARWKLPLVCVITR